MSLREAKNVFQRHCKVLPHRPKQIWFSIASLLYFLVYPLVLGSHTLLNGQVEFEFCRQFVFGVQSVGEVDSSDSAVGMNLGTKLNESDDQ